MFILKQLRRKKNISQTDLARAIGVSLRTIQLYEKKDANIPIKNLRKIAEYFDLTIAELYSHEVNEADGMYYSSVKKHIKKDNTIEDMGAGKYLITVPLITGEITRDYSRSWEDKTYTEGLSRMSFVIEDHQDARYLAFEVTNTSMDDGSIEGIPNKAIVLGRQVSVKELPGILEEATPAPIFMMVYQQDVLCKKIVAYQKEEGTITCHSLSTSPEYSDFEIPLSEIGPLFLVVKKQIS